MIERKLPPPEQYDEPPTDDQSQIDMPEDELNEDGSMDVDMDEGNEPDGAVQFDSNLAEHMDEEDLGSLSDELTECYEADKVSRAEWEETYIRGLDLLGVKMEDRTRPWPGACGVYHPVLAEAAIRYEAQTIMELFPPQGPAKSKIIGPETEETFSQAQRVEAELNHTLVDRMCDYRDETESLLFRQALAGSAFKKVYYNSATQLPAAKFVPAEDLVVPYGECDLRTAERFTQIDRITANELKRRQVSGFYRDIDIDDPSPLVNKVDEKEAELTGIKKNFQNDERYTILEMHVNLDLDDFPDEDKEGEPTGLALPYIVTIEESSKKILAVYRNWKEKDPLKCKRDYFVHYKYLPGLGFYGFGLIHILGGLTASSTSILRQLVDAGTLSNLPGGLKSRGLRIKGDDSPIRPGEFRDVDVASGTVKDSISFLPYKEPSMVLYQLLGNVVDEARRIGSVADMDIGDSNQEAPVGTTLALMERALKVMSAVQARTHAAVAQELRLIAKVIADYMPPQYDYDVGGNFNRQQDFQETDVIPVSDPGATTMSQRVVQYQAVIQLASQNPQIYDMRRLNLDMLNVLGIKDAASLVPDPGNIPPTDPVTENMNILKGSPVKAYSYQDQQAHMAVHMAMLQDPKITSMVGQSPQAGQMQQAMAAHMAEHLAFAYRQGIEEKLGTSLPPPDQPMPPDLEVQVSRLVAQAAPKLLAQHQDEAAQQQAQQTMQDPLVQLQMDELALKRQSAQDKADLERQKINLEAQKADQQAKVDMTRIEVQAGLEGTKLGIDSAAKQAQVAVQQMQVNAGIEQAKIQASSRPKGNNQ